VYSKAQTLANLYLDDMAISTIVEVLRDDPHQLTQSVLRMQDMAQVPLRLLVMLMGLSR
jgi:hypothetical protein